MAHLPFDPVVVALPVFGILMLAELWFGRKHHKEIYEKKDFFASLAMGVGMLIIGVGVKTVAFMAMLFLFQFAPETMIELLDIRNWWAWVIILFADDFTFYIHHRASHEIRILWAAHVNHHSSQRYNLGTAVRQSWTEVFYKYIWWMWMPLAGFSPIMIVTMMSFSLIYQFWIHTEAISKLGPFEWFFNTPSHHRVHHASNHKYLDRNHAGILIIWDRLFGTFVEEDLEKPVYGITNNIYTFNPFKIATHEFADLWKDIKRAPDLVTKLKYVFNPPGWSHDGPDLTAETLRKSAHA